MALDVDGLAILNAIATRPEAFPDIGAEIAKAGRALVIKQLKARSMSVTGLRLIRGSLGPESFSLVVDGLSDAEAKNLVSRLDKNHPDLKTAAADWPRRHLVSLAAGTNPVARPAAPGAEPKPNATKTLRSTRALGSAAFAANWDGKDYDPKPKKAKKGG
ncbi:MAG: hypothetical protein K2Y56_13170 [Methylobacterium sp.]|uniref:hypothetical protein n=1 Tax=Methylobacterium sp. TaxID=409 RepID=UPI0025D7ACF2|nr:hypothetical protein [Methylobacterium sp.]MBX9932471.1 hypothetical protein [Methylobacterium sp.]